MLFQLMTLLGLFGSSLRPVGISVLLLRNGQDSACPISVLPVPQTLTLWLQRGTEIYPEEDHSWTGHESH